MFEEVPRFISGSEWLENVKNLLKNLGVRFEAEESVRIHKDDVVVEVLEKDGRFAVVASVEVPRYLDIEEVDRYVKTYRDLLMFIAKTGLEPSYELDTSIGYTFLRAVVEVEDLGKLLELLRKVLS